MNSVNPVPITGLSGVTAVSMGYRYACAIAGGGVQCWGDLGSGEYNSPTAVPGLASGATSVSVGYRSACAVVNGGVQCWGDNS